MNTKNTVRNPSKTERFTLRFLIVFGVLSMFYFVSYLTDPAIISYVPLYILFLTALVFTLLKILFEWYHYFFISIKKAPQENRRYSVDILTTFCKGEPYEMMDETLRAIKAITYPHETYLCDEADDPYLKNLCAGLGIHHITRVEKTDAKAGNINNALKCSSGELCVVLDPDHVPFPNFLDPIVAHFNDEKVGFVQIVQAYKNYDDGLIAKGAAQQTFQFYGPMMMTMNTYGTVQAIGANCTFRRTALESIGGHAAGLAEDMHTSMHLHAKGWKSVYLPLVLARGLVPNTLSAYYKQQLKWARGVFDLFVIAYPKLFRHFTWRQKIHYALTPVYYLSGIITLINFLIPVIALTFGIMPVKTDLVLFCLSGLPLVVFILLVRHFVQKWVMEDEERGFHVVGGLLMIGTWWIFILGLIYTITGKKVPYVPTPKDGKEANNWPLNIPNLFVLIVSAGAIFYGLYIDWNPYAFIMAGLAAMNCFFMVFTMAASRQHEFRRYKNTHKHLSKFIGQISLVKKLLWLFRRKMYQGVRRAALPIALLFIGVLGFVIYHRVAQSSLIKKPVQKQTPFLNGIFYPDSNDGTSSIQAVNSLDKKNRLSIVSTYVAWGDGEKSQVPVSLLSGIYRRNRIPLITWEPWQNLFAAHRGEDRNVFRNIYEGKYDAYIRRFATQLKAFDRPVFLRFAHEADNPMYPWSPSGGNRPADFKKAWMYVHQMFDKAGAYNVIWVWNPWKPAAAQAYFPGESYVDWMGVDILDYAQHQPNDRSYTFAQLYAPFHRSTILHKTLPVMVCEMGSLLPQQKKQAWMADAFRTIKNRYKEIRAAVVFNSGYDENLVVKEASGVLDWRFPGIDSLLINVKTRPVPVLKIKQNKVLLPIAIKQTAFKNIRGVNYKSGSNWKKTDYPVSRREMHSDFAAMKSYGINTVKIYGPSVYDRNLFSALKTNNLKAHYAFWIPEDIDFTSPGAQQLYTDILETVRDEKDNTAIEAWNLANPVINRLEAYYTKPILLYKQQQYILWIKKLATQIKQINPDRKLSLDVEVSGRVNQYISMMASQIPGIDAYGLICDRVQKIDGIAINVPWFYSSITPENYVETKAAMPSFLSDWRDEATQGSVGLHGLRDFENRNKNELYQVLALWKDHTFSIPKSAGIDILRPAVTLYPGDKQVYYALVNSKEKWGLADDRLGLRYEWYLIKTDEFKNAVGVKKLGDGLSVKLTVPENPDTYRIYLIAVKNNNVSTVSVPLNLPLYKLEKPNLHGHMVEDLSSSNRHQPPGFAR